ncbi:MAG: aminoacyl-tRNA hydrolase [Clostridia bacterium]|nr:aminoacyl-tRNA hydrolase [Clostridia bacterium]
MLVVFGLGNPGTQYARTRHNVGFDVLDVFCEQEHLRMTKLDHHGLISESGFGNGKLILVKPQTYMNLSGNCVSEVISWYKPEPEETLVVYDDIDLPLGKLRMRKKGSAGTHNGMRSIVSLCGRDDFPRLRVGVGAKPPQWDLADYVLSHYQEGEEQETQFAAFLKAAEVIRVMWTQGLDRAMQLANASDKKDRKEAGEETK